MAAKIIKPRGTRSFRTTVAGTRRVGRTTVGMPDFKTGRTTSGYRVSRKAA